MLWLILVNLTSDRVPNALYVRAQEGHSVV